MLKIACAATTALVLSACVPTTPPYLISPANPTLAVREPAYTPVTSGVKEFQVVEPRNWIEQNRQVGPQEGRTDSGQSSTSGARRGR